MVVAGQDRVRIFHKITERKVIIVLKIFGQKMVKVHINDNACVARKNTVESVTAVKNHGVGVGKMVDETVQCKALSDIVAQMSEARMGQAALGKIAHKITDHYRFVAARQGQVG